MSRPFQPRRNAPLDASRCAILIIDVQDGIFNAAAETERPYFHRTARDTVIPNIARLIRAGRAAEAEIVYTVIESLTADGRDRSIDYKETGFHVPRGSAQAKVVAALAPADDDIVLPKTSSSLFNSTVFEYAMRNMGVDTIVVTGFLTDQCVDHTIRDGADRGFAMVCPQDACTTDTQGRHDAAIFAFKGYCRLTTTQDLVAELGGSSPLGSASSDAS
ncbi:isochorismatase family cysteine hydrolase [Aureimonas frigidaquae]|uniref:Putative amidase n=1 Tax=Aureimonas frigidaquae TaxID=424757 RepID=A0A0P0Z0K4_9HYPH|nr:isochorismatase family cysteine hydrolase [Aureimonas frigidaquae]BAT27435.1 putative amidase [Aureimonas frigidaquae]